MGIAASADRVTFYEEQARHRRAARWLGLWCLLAVVILALAASVVLSPLVILLAAVLARLTAYAVMIPQPVWDLFRRLVVEFDALEHLVRRWPLIPSDLWPAVQMLAPLLLPGVIAIVLLWRLMDRLFRRFRVGDALLPPGSEANRGDPEERQVVALVEGVSLAAGMTPPRVLIVDDPAANAACAGSSPQDVTLLISRGLLSTLDREETEGVVAHLLAWVGQGNLHLTRLILSIVHTFGLLVAALDAPLDGAARRALCRFVGFCVRRAAGRAGQQEADALSASLSGIAGLETMTETGGFIDDMDRPHPLLIRPLLYLRFFALLPLFLAGLLAKMVLLFATLLLVGPMLWGTLRARRRLADAGAVELTRDPDGLARALVHLGRHATGGPAGGRLLWIVPGAVRGRTRRGPEGTGDPEGPKGDSLLFAGTHPSLASRIRRLRALGSTVPLPEPAKDAATARRGAMAGHVAANAQAPPQGQTAPKAQGQTEGVEPSAQASGGRPPLLSWLLLAVVVGAAALLIVMIAQFVLYMVAVAMIAGLALVGGFFILVMRAVALLLP